MISSLVLAFCVASVLIGGIKRIASVSQVIVPFMAIIYFLFAGILIVTNITAVPSAIAVIVEAAFSPRAITGGVVGSMFVAMQKVLHVVSSQMKPVLVVHQLPQLPHRQKNLSVRGL